MSKNHSSFSSKLKNALGNGDSDPNRNNFPVLKIGLMALGFGALVWYYEPSRQILFGLGTRLKSTLLISSKDGSDLNTTVEKSAESNKTASKWVGRVATVFIILRVGVDILNNNGINIFNTSESISKDIKPESRLSSILKILKNPEAVGGIFGCIGGVLSFVPKNLPVNIIGNGFLVIGWQILSNFVKPKA